VSNVRYKLQVYKDKTYKCKDFSAVFSCWVSVIEMQKYLALPYERFTGLSLESFEGAQCRVCLSLACDASATACGHLYCYTCIARALEIKPACPTCNQATTIDNVVPSHVHRVQVQGFHVLCPCGSTVALGKMSEHAALCDESDVPCRFFDQCGTVISKQLMSIHNAKCWPVQETRLARVCLSATLLDDSVFCDFSVRLCVLFLLLGYHFVYVCVAFFRSVYTTHPSR